MMNNFLVLSLFFWKESHTNVISNHSTHFESQLSNLSTSFCLRSVRLYDLIIGLSQVSLSIFLLVIIDNKILFSKLLLSFLSSFFLCFTLKFLNNFLLCLSSLLFVKVLSQRIRSPWIVFDFFNRLISKCSVNWFIIRVILVKYWLMLIAMTSL
jgi:hypothetical protein